MQLLLGYVGLINVVVLAPILAVLVRPYPVWYLYLNRIHRLL